MLMRIVAVGIIANKLRAPAERMHDAIVVEHRKMPFPVVHVAFEHCRNMNHR